MISVSLSSGSLAALRSLSFALVSRVEPICTMALKVLVIGAGAGGLVTLKTLLEASERDPLHPISPLLVEAEEDLGGTFKASIAVLGGSLAD